MSGQERKRRVIATRKADEDPRPPPPTAKIVTVDERRNVMRNLPDPKHFPEIMSLMKGEVKKDLREMESRDVLFAKRPPEERDARPSGVPSGVLPLQADAFPPAVLSESTLPAKKKRYARWDASPDAIDAELGTWRRSVAEAKLKLAKVEEARAGVTEAYHATNDALVATLGALRGETLDAEALLGAIAAVALKEAEAVADVRSGTARRRNKGNLMEPSRAVHDALAAFGELGQSLDAARNMHAALLKVAELDPAFASSDAAKEASKTLWAPSEAAGLCAGSAVLAMLRRVDPLAFVGPLPEFLAAPLAALEADKDEKKHKDKSQPCWAVGMPPCASEEASALVRTWKALAADAAASTAATLSSGGASGGSNGLPVLRLPVERAACVDREHVLASANASTSTAALQPPEHTTGISSSSTAALENEGRPWSAALALEHFLDKVDKDQALALKGAKDKEGDLEGRRNRADSDVAGVEGQGAPALRLIPAHVTLLPNCRDLVDSLDPHVAVRAIADKVADRSAAGGLASPTTVAASSSDSQASGSGLVLLEAALVHGDAEAEAEDEALASLEEERDGLREQLQGLASDHLKLLQGLAKDREATSGRTARLVMLRGRSERLRRAFPELGEHEERLGVVTLAKSLSNLSDPLALMAEVALAPKANGDDAEEEEEEEDDDEDDDEAPREAETHGMWGVVSPSIASSTAAGHSSSQVFDASALSSAASAAASAAANAMMAGLVSAFRTSLSPTRPGDMDDDDDGSSDDDDEEGRGADDDDEEEEEDEEDEEGADLARVSLANGLAGWTAAGGFASPDDENEDVGAESSYLPLQQQSSSQSSFGGGMALGGPPKGVGGRGRGRGGKVSGAPKKQTPDATMAPAAAGLSAGPSAAAAISGKRKASSSGEQPAAAALESAEVPAAKRGRAPQMSPAKQRALTPALAAAEAPVDGGDVSAADKKTGRGARSKRGGR